MNFLVYVLFLSFLAPLAAYVQEAAHFRELVQLATQDTLVLIDIDDTIFIPAQTLGSDVWYGSRMEKYKAQGLSSVEAKEKALSELRAIRQLTQVQLVEPDTAKVIEELQKQGIACLGVTAQGLALATETVRHLNSLGVNFSQSVPFDGQDCYFLNNDHGVLFRQGVLFTSGTAKYSAVSLLLKAKNYLPKAMLLIDDKEKHVVDMEHFCQREHIPFIGLRYSFSDARTYAFDERLAEYQWTHSTFAHILSDAEARAQLELLSK
jgi:hypothetical protein